MDQQYSIYRLHAKVRQMEEFLDLDAVLRGDKNTPEQIMEYYRINHPMYRMFHSQDGFMHFRVSLKGVFTDEDVYYQPDFISKEIHPGDKVLELGAGQGSNLIYLAHCNPQAKFCGVDLQPRKRDDIPSNARLFQQNYSDLHMFRDNTFDVVYGIETIVHSTDKEQVLREVFRVMKPGGKLIVYDYSLNAEFETFDEEIRKSIALVSKGGAAAVIESTASWNKHFANTGFKLTHYADLSRYTLPDLRHLSGKPTYVMNHPALAKALFAVLPTQFMNNFILGYLGYDTVNSGVIAYSEWVYRKP
ncbi:MAG: methyltransferase domain-containing protein [Oscillospiraceae bacterium]|nr:methyltransferase domain-containing protein [Oscillospiraceae bacterium]